MTTTTKHSPELTLDRLIRAKYPIVVIRSHEEARVQRSVRVVADLQRKPLFVWTCSDGLAQLEGDQPSKMPDKSQTKSAITAFQAIRQWPQISGAEPDSPALFLFKDLHTHWTHNPVIVRHLRDIAVEFQTRPYTLIVMAPNVSNNSMFSDLEKQTVMIDWPLPEAAEMAEVIEWFVDDLQSNPNDIPVEINGDRSQVIRALMGLTELQARNVLSMSVVGTGAFSLDCIPFILEQKRQLIAQSGVLEYFETDTGDGDIGGLDLLKVYARHQRAAFSEEADAYGLDKPRGFLMVGVPGSGKSLVAKASTGGEMPLLRLDVGALMGSLVGQSEANARRALEVAQAVAPCVLWIDEIEKALSGVGSGANDGGVTRRVFGTLLTWMQENTAPVLVVATANDVRSLPPELLRAGRFDSIWWVDVPTASVRAEIAAIHLGKRLRAPDGFDLQAVARATEGFTGAEVEQVVVEALRAGFVDGKREIVTDDLLAAAAQIVPVTRTMGTQIEELRSWASTRARPASSREAEPVASRNGRRVLEMG